MIGRSISHYKVTGRIGAGGMGEVYRARDSRLERDVALKVLPDVFAGDPDRLMRFEREARLLASLNHANIATIHGIEQDGSHRVLVMELVEGEDLSVRLAKGPMPLEEALQVARQIADALDAAHEQGVVHRDLKPANIVLTPDGNVKVLDFGLAKAVEGDASNSGLSQSPTVLGNSPTVAGVILGTAAYMSPEQARGKRVDRRADIFAFGCVLFEMLTGRQTFSGETVSDTLAAVLRAEPEWGALPTDTPSAIVRLLRRCLNKDPKQRLRDIGEARIAIEAVQRGEGDEASATPTAASTAKRPWLVWALSLVLVLCAAGWLLTALRPDGGVTSRAITAAINVPQDAPLSVYGSHPGPPAISPDGRMVAFAVSAPSGVLLGVRDLARDEIRTFTGTDDAGYPFWSPDSRQIGFFAGGKLKRVDVTGGVPVVLCTAEVGKGGTWRSDGTILFAPSYTSPIHRVSAAGGESVAITQLDSTRSESSHRFPRFLPDEEHFLYVVRHFSANDQGGHELRVASIDGKESKDLFATETDAMYANGYIFFVREGALIAQSFDVKSLTITGDPVKLADDVQLLSGAAHGVFDVSPSGVMVYGHGSNASTRHLLLLDGAGRAQGEIGEGAEFDIPVQLSPDGATVLSGIFNSVGGTGDLWLIDLARGARTRMTFDPGHDNGGLWSPDGRRIAFTAQRGATFGPYLKPIDGSANETRLLDSGTDLFNAGWTPDGRYLMCHELGSRTAQGKLRAIPLVDGAPDPLQGVTMPPSLGGGAGLYRIAFSPDARWMAYESTEGGRENIFAIPFGRAGRRWQITLNGANTPRWAGEHLYFVRERRLWKIPVKLNESSLEIGTESRVYSDRWVDSFDVSRDESRIVILTGENQSIGTGLTVVLNWPALLTSGK